MSKNDKEKDQKKSSLEKLDFKKLRSFLKEVAENKINEIVEVVTNEFSEYEISDEMILGSLRRIVGDLNSIERKTENMNATVRQIALELEEISDMVDLMYKREQMLKDQMAKKIRDQLLDSKILGKLNWALRENYSGLTFFLDADEEDVQNIHAHIHGPLKSYGYHWGSAVYQFENGKELIMNGNDGELSIDLNYDEFTPNEYLEAFKALGIQDVDLSTVQESKQELLGKVKILDDFVEKFKGDEIKTNLNMLEEENKDG